MKILITGSTGLLARGFEEAAPSGRELVGLHLRGYAPAAGRIRHLSGDVRDEAALARLFQAERFEAVVHAAGLASVDAVERDPAAGRSSNLEGTRAVARACRRAGAYLVFVSTNAVFDGTAAPYAEDAAPSPGHHYGRIKLECEAAAAEAGDFSIARPILLYGRPRPEGRPNPVSWVLDKLSRGERVRLVDDVRENPLYNLECGRALWAMVEKRPRGVFHLGGQTRVSRYELGLAVARVFGFDASLLERVDSSAFPELAPRPKDTTLSTARMEDELGLPAIPLKEGLADMKARRASKNL